MIWVLLGMAPSSLLAALGAWFLFRLVRQQDRIAARLDSIDQNLIRMGAAVQKRRMKESLDQLLLEQQKAPTPTRPSGLPAGAPAPDFDLPDLTGRRHKLQDFRGRKVLLVFLNPGCGPCQHLAPALAKLSPDGAGGRAVPVVISGGADEANRQMVEEHDLHCPFLLDPKSETISRYQSTATPTGYLIDEQGVVASPLALGADALLALVGAAPSGHADETKPKGKENRGLAASKINRDGLKAGTPAPHFRLPKLDGGELALEEMAGRPLLLVFSDPQCGPCNAVAAELEQLHRRMSEVQFVMISRRDAESNQKKAAENGLTFPVVLQKEWEISKLYGIFATPVGYLIDEKGIIVRDVAKGQPEILALLAPAAPAARAA